MEDTKDRTLTSSLHPFGLLGTIDWCLQSEGSASFLRAARGGNLDKVLEFLKSGTDINTSNANGLNALHLASKEGHANIVNELLRRGANVDAATKVPPTPRHVLQLHTHTHAQVEGSFEDIIWAMTPLGGNNPLGTKTVSHPIRIDRLGKLGIPPFLSLPDKVARGRRNGNGPVTFLSTAPVPVPMNRPRGLNTEQTCIVTQTQPTHLTTNRFLQHSTALI